MTYGLNQYYLYIILIIIINNLKKSKHTYNKILFQNEFGLSEDQVAGTVVIVYLPTY